MQIKNLKELEKLIQLCQKYQIEKIEVGTVKVTVPLLAPEPQIEHMVDGITEQNSPTYDVDDVTNWSTNN